MGRKSVRENKNIYQTAREEAGLSRQAAALRMQYVSENRIESIENNESSPHPEEIKAMAQAYKKPSLCNYYCSNECPIGKGSIPQIRESQLSQIVLEMVVSLNNLNTMKDRLMEITVDGKITEEELPDFVRIRNRLNEMSQEISSLQLWLDNAIASGTVDITALKAEEARSSKD